VHLEVDDADAAVFHEEVSGVEVAMAEDPRRCRGSGSEVLEEAPKKTILRGIEPEPAQAAM